MSAINNSIHLPSNAPFEHFPRNRCVSYLSLSKLKNINFGAELFRIGINFAKSIDRLPEFGANIVPMLKMPCVFSMLYSAKLAQRSVYRLHSDIGYEDFESVQNSVMNLFIGTSEMLNYAKSFYGGIKDVCSFPQVFPLGSALVTFTRIIFITKILFRIKTICDSVLFLRQVEKVKAMDHFSLEAFIDKQIRFTHEEIANGKFSISIRKKEQFFIRNTSKTAFAQLKQLQIFVRSLETAPTFAKITINNIKETTKKNMMKAISKLASDILKLIALVFLAFNTGVPLAFAFLFIRKALNPIIRNCHSQLLKSLPKPIPARS